MSIFKVYLPGMKVPSWLQAVKPDSSEFKIPAMTFGSTSLVFAKGGRYIAVNLGFGSFIKVRDGLNVTITGQSPPGGAGGVFWYPSVFSAIGAAVRRKGND